MLGRAAVIRQSLGIYLQQRFYSMNLQEVVERLNGFASPSLAESWDNVGLLVEPHTKRTIETLMLTNDLTEAVMDEAEQHNVNFILSYHPPLFRPLKRITSNAWKERIVARCLEKGMAIYSPHTSYDALKGGVNDWLIQAFEDAISVVPLQQSCQSPKHSHKVTVEANQHIDVSALIGNLKCHVDESCLFSVRTTDGSFSILCRENHLPILVTNLSTMNDLQIAITKLDQVPLDGHGMGRKCKLSSPVTLQEAVDKIKSHLNLPFVRLALASGATSDSLVQSVAVCAGSGSSVLRGTRADLWLTGEMSHHELLDATHQGISVVLTDHSNTERGFLKVLQPKLIELFEQKVKVIISEKDRDPLQVI